MEIAVDFAFRIVIENLDTGERRSYLVPRGTHSFMEDPDGYVRGKPATPLEGPNPLTPPEDDLPPPPSVPEIPSRPLTSVRPGASRLNPGKTGEHISPKDLYGVPEG